MKKLYYLIGYPASGKTTLAKKLKEEKGYEYVSGDEIFAELFGRGLKYSKILSEQPMKIYLDIINKGMNCKNIVLDIYTPTKEERSDILSIIPKTYEKIAVVMDTDKEECIKRFVKREKLRKGCLPNFVNEIIEMPDLNEFDRIIRSSDVLSE